MSHIGNKIRAGFFATPQSQGEYIKQLLSFSNDCSIFDPTCGEGAILAQIAENQEHTIKTYGVELDKRRAAIATDVLDHCIQAPIESMVISNETFGLIYLNPPYDMTLKGEEDTKTDRKEYLELVRNTRYLKPGGVIVYVIPSYRFADEKIARYLANNFEKMGIVRFSDEDYDDFRQCIFIGHRKEGKFKEFNEKLFNFLLQMDSEEFVLSQVTPINKLIGHHQWIIPQSQTEIKTFYTTLQNKSDFVDAIRNSKGFLGFIAQSKPRSLEIGGNPIIPPALGNLALMLSSGACNGIIGEGKDLHAVQGLEIVSKIRTEEKQTHDNGSTTTMTKIRTKREASVKVITPSGLIKKFV